MLLVHSWNTLAFEKIYDLDNIYLSYLLILLLFCGNQNREKKADWNNASNKTYIEDIRI